MPVTSGCAWLGGGRGVRWGWRPVAVLGSFEGPVGHLAFDHAGAGPVASWRQQTFGDLSQGAGQCPGESARGENAVWAGTWRRTIRRDRVKDMRSDPAQIRLRSGLPLTTTVG